MADATNTCAYEGMERPGNSSNDSNVHEFLIDRRLNDISTATLVKIVKAPYDKDGNTIPAGTPGVPGFVDVVPLVNQLDGYGNSIPHDTVFRLAYHRFEGGAGAIICDPGEGDIGKMVVADRDTSSVRRTGEQSDPGSRRKFSKADGTFFGKTQSKTPPNQYVTFTANGVIIADKNGNKIEMMNGLITITGNVKITGNAEIGGTLKVDGATTVQDINIQGSETGGGPD